LINNYLRKNKRRKREAVCRLSVSRNSINTYCN